MNTVILSQSGVHTQAHPVCGKSGKFYGQATQGPVIGTVFYAMSIQDYQAAADDIMANPTPQQQWVPKFVDSATAQMPVPLPPAQPAPKVVDARVGGGGNIFEDPRGPSLPQPEDKRVPPSFVGSAAEEFANRDNTNGHSMPESIRSTEPLWMERPADVNAPVAKPAALPLPPLRAWSEEVLENVISEKVEIAVTKALQPLIGRIVASPEAPKTRKTAKKKEPTAMQVLQSKAKGLGINTFGKSKASLEAEIAQLHPQAAPE